MSRYTANIEALEQAVVEDLLAIIKSNRYYAPADWSQEDRFDASMTALGYTYGLPAFELVDEGRASMAEASRAFRLLDAARTRFTDWAPAANAHGQALLRERLAQYLEATRLLVAKQQSLDLLAA